MFSDGSNSKTGKNVVRRIGLSLQYDGSAFCGWQKQKQGISVQSVIEEAIYDLDPNRPINLFAAGRTDSGVHAAGQVVHFDCSGYIPPNQWAGALNGRLPNTIRIRESICRPLNWHACYSAIYRRYRYTIYNGCRPNIFLANWSWHRYRFRLDENLMRLAGKELIGLHDFSAFRRAGSNRNDSWTTIQEVSVEREGDLVVLDIQASGFLYGMVRLLVGQLVALGEHRLTLDLFRDRWKQCRREEVRYAAPPNGLCFVRAGYKDSIFSEAAWFDSFPKYFLGINDPPNDPP
ncbi:tRNA pseudouridine(38-40) synthase TruA [Prochlorococcus sp. MIT 1223]|uniref:tRNA pseudouridine(38-40) synthase TruA n=1 Tax=Prochlorococcus sp. MIT 1223 TaxID=3096217 RepID=UPI002A7476DF|nr:tRNA pseudouridine(38-40) synthase TruA [Prochlorococcus sp. MIT 1223]